MPAHSTTSPQAERPPLSLLVLPPVAVLTACGACLWGAAAAAPSTARSWVISVGVSASVLLSAAATVAAIARHGVRHLRGRLATRDAEVDRLSERLAQMRADAVLLADDILPALVEQVRGGATADTALAEVPQPTVEIHRRTLYALAEELAQGERMRAATLAACSSGAGRVQALATSMLADLREMENSHDEDVLGDLLKLDHSTAQAGRLADSIVVLTGGRSGRRWTKPIVMESLLRGAVGRISAFQRVRLHSASGAAVVGHAAEGTMHALAELMDNAARFSPPTEEVHVYVEELTSGVVVTIEDGGLVMGPAALARAQRAVSAEPLDVTTLSGTRLGLAVVGSLVRKHGLTVSFRPSSRGGTSAVVLIPQHLITQPVEAAPTSRSVPSGSGPTTASRTVQASARAATAAPAAGPLREAKAAELPLGDAPFALPKRRRGQTLAAAERSVPPAAKPERPPADAGARFSAFRQASRGRAHGDGSSAPSGADGS